MKLNTAGVLVVMPARNEAASIAQVLFDVQSVLSANDRILVINDGSVDNTAQEAEKAGAMVLNPKLPLGAWGATQAGIRYAITHGFHTVLTMDADGQHPALVIDDLLNRLAEGDCDVVIGACPERGSALRHAAWWLFRLLTGFYLEDLTSGFRAYGSRALPVLASKKATLLDYQDVGVLLLLRRAGLSLTEVPVPMLARQHGKSRIFNNWWVVGRYMFETAVLCVARWHPSPPPARTPRLHPARRGQATTVWKEPPLC